MKTVRPGFRAMRTQSRRGDGATGYEHLSRGRARNQRDAANGRCGICDVARGHEQIRWRKRKRPEFAGWFMAAGYFSLFVAWRFGKRRRLRSDPENGVGPDSV
jgi:hypothetical protein